VRNGLELYDEAAQSIPSVKEATIGTLTASRSSSTAFGAITVVITLLGWSSVPLFLRHFADHIDFWTSNGWRYGFSALVWLPVLIAISMRSRLPKGLWKAALVPSIVNAAGQILFTWAHYRIDPGLLTFGLRSQLIFVAIGAWLMFPRERAIIRTPGYLIGAGLLISGTIGVMLLNPEQDAAHTVMAGTGVDRGTRASHIEGVLLAVGSGLLFACYGLSVRKFMEGVNSVVAFGSICQYTAIIMVGLMLVFGKSAGRAALDLQASQMSLLLLSALIGIAFGHMFYYMSIARLGVAVTAGVLQLQPFFVLLGSMSLFDERLSTGQWLGGCVAVTGAMLMLAVQYFISRARHVSEKPLAIAEGESGA
jgi:drug/metabolite transporter (DMT)-like permease